MSKIKQKLSQTKYQNLSIKLLCIALMILFASPILYITSTWFTDNIILFQTIPINLIVDSIFNSIALVVLVSFFCFCIGVSCAWFVSYYDFWGVNFFQNVLIFPLAIPIYIMAFIYGDMLSYNGLLYRFFDTIGFIPYSNALNFWILVLVFVLALYPYTFLLVLSYFKTINSQYLFSAKLLGKAEHSLLFKIGIPIAKPAIIASLLIISLETLSEFGGVDYFGINVFSTMIFKSWQNYQNINATLQFSSLLIILTCLIFFISKYYDKKKYFVKKTTQFTHKKKLNLKYYWWIWLLLFLPFLFGFLLPVLQLVLWIFQNWSIDWLFKSLKTSFNSISIALISSVICVTLSILYLYFKVLIPKLFGLFQINLWLLYSVPAIIIGISLFYFINSVDNFIIQLVQSLFAVDINILTTGSIFTLMIFYVIRFSGISLFNISASHDNTMPQIFNISRILGLGPIKSFIKVVIPSIRYSIMISAILVFIEILKELPGTLVLIPFNLQTIPVEIYLLASDEQIEKAALMCLFLILISFISVILFKKIILNNAK